MEERLVDVYIASLPRQLHIIKTVQSLWNQPEFGTISITCNNYTDMQWAEVQDALRRLDVLLYRGDNAKESNEKLKYLSTGSNYYIACVDDDLIYAPDYLKKLIKGCENYSAHVGLHGCVLSKGQISSYYRDRISYHCLKDVLRDTEVEILGNGVSLWKRQWYSDYDSWYENAPNVGCDDILVAIAAKRKGRRMIVLSHREGYITHKEQEEGDDYVFDKYKFNDSVQTDYINKIYKRL